MGFLQVKRDLYLLTENSLPIDPHHGAGGLCGTDDALDIGLAEGGWVTKCVGQNQACEMNRSAQEMPS